MTCLADLFQHFDEEGEFVLGHVGELAFVAIHHGLLEFREEGEALRGDAGGHDAAVFRVPLTGDEASRFEAIEQAGDVGVAGDHSLGDGFAGEAVGGGISEDSQDVELGGGETPRFEKFVKIAHQAIGGADDVEEDLHLEALEGATAMHFFEESSRHGYKAMKRWR